KTRIHFERGALHNLRGHQSRRADRHDLVIVAMKNESWHVELLEVLSKIRLREGLDAVIARFHPSHHPLPPPVLPDAFGNLGARPVVSVEREGNVLIKLG